MDSIGMGTGGRLAKINAHKDKRRRITSMMNTVETKRLDFIKRQIEEDKSTSLYNMERNTKKIFQSNDDIKAFQKALLHRITTVQEQRKTSAGMGLLNLGRYGGLSIEKIKIDSMKFRPIRSPTKRRMIKTRILLEQGKRNGRIKTFEASTLGDVTESILKLEKVIKPPTELSKNHSFTTSNLLPDVKEVDENEINEKENLMAESTREEEREKIFVRRRRLILPPLQVTRSIQPNKNYYREISAQYKRIREELNKSRTNLADIPESRLRDMFRTPQSLRRDHSYEPNHVHEKKPEESKGQHRKIVKSRRKYYEWDYTEPLGPVPQTKSIGENQRFWKPIESVVPKRFERVILPRIG